MKPLAIRCPFHKWVPQGEHYFWPKETSKKFWKQIGTKKSIIPQERAQKLRPGQKLGGAYLHCNAMQCIEGPWQYIAYSANFTN